MAELIDLTLTQPGGSWHWPTPAAAPQDLYTLAPDRGEWTLDGALRFIHAGETHTEWFRLLHYDRRDGVDLAKYFAAKAHMLGTKLGRDYAHVCGFDPDARAALLEAASIAASGGA